MQTLNRGPVPYGTGTESFVYAAVTSKRTRHYGGSFDMPSAMTSANGLICFTNCLLAQEDGSLTEKDLWIDERRGVILDAQRTFYLRKERPARIIDLKGNILSPGYIDLQLNGGYGFDFSVYYDEESYKCGMQLVAERIIETGVTSLLPTVITQNRSLYPLLLNLLRPFSTPTSATLLGFHAEGPFLNVAKRGAHASPFLLSAPEGTATFENVYGFGNLVDKEDWLMAVDGQAVGVRMITAAPEIDGVMNAISELSKRGVIISIGHSVASSDIATLAMRHGARMITHLFNAMPQLHHRDPTIIGLLGASPHLSSPLSPISLYPAPNLASGTVPSDSAPNSAVVHTTQSHAEAIDTTDTPPQTPGAAAASGASTPLLLPRKGSRTELHLEKGEVTDMAFVRPFYGMIVDGIHSHPNSVRLAYSAHPEGCILVTDAQKTLDPNLRDGVHEWRDGQRFVKEGDRLYLEGTNTLAGSVITLDKSVRNFSRFTGCSLGEAIKCATFNPAQCVGIENRKGTLRPGADADLIVLDRKGIVQNTWVRGREAWIKPT